MVVDIGFRPNRPSPSGPTSRIISSSLTDASSLIDHQFAAEFVSASFNLFRAETPT
ncbi:uncharacterized protein G2W53_034447 [Senna tora]|uniref:Uncharacterized protein n=1 Tax=Senna tora TaxID=362788 RepID=A0A834WBX3_9FABA|nr:uncharacterized protein G2W53_034447 [Senna tora]